MSAGPQPLRIGVDLTPMREAGVNGGAKPAALNLVKSMARSGRVRITAFVRKTYAEALPFSPSENVEVVRLDDGFIAQASALLQAGGPWSVARALGCDVVFAPFGDPILAEPGLAVVSQRYDLQHLDYPEFFSDDERQHRAISDARLATFSTRIVTSSAHARSRLVANLGIDADLIEVIPLPLPSVPSPPDPAVLDAVLLDLGIPRRPYIYYPANFWPHKNHFRLLEAFALASTKHGFDADLVLSGDTLGSEGEIADRARDLGIDQRVHILGFLSDPDRHMVWSGSTGLIFPSLYEGFGIPLQEALLYGKPIAASNACSIPEVGGEAAIYFDPADSAAIAGAMRQLLEPGIGERLKTARERQLATFEPEAIVARYLAVFDEAMGPSGTSRQPSTQAANLDIVITECDQPDCLKRTLESLVPLSASVREIILVALCSSPEALVCDSTQIAPTRDLGGLGDSVQGSTLVDALRRTQDGLVLFVRAGDLILADAAARALRAHDAFPQAAVIQGIRLPASNDAATILPPQLLPIPALSRFDRHSQHPATSLVSKSALGAHWTIPSGRFALELTLAQLPADALSLRLPMHLGQEGDPRQGTISDLESLDYALRDLGIEERDPWLLDLCSRIPAGLTIGTDWHSAGESHAQSADRLLWAAPLLYRLAGLAFTDSTRGVLAARWRDARFSDVQPGPPNPLREILRTSPRTTILSGLVGPPLDDRAARTFATVPDRAVCTSALEFRRALAAATEADLHPDIREIMNLSETRDFVVSAFEHVSFRTPTATDVRAVTLEFGDDRRLDALKAIINTAIARDRDEIERAALARTPFASLRTPTKVYPLGSTSATTADEWLRHASSTAQEPATASDSSDAPGDWSGASHGGSSHAPEVSILCSVYAGDQFIEPYLHNIVGQDGFEHCELIIVDACSPGSEREIIGTFSDRFPNIQYTRTECRIGIYAAWNLAISLASGRYLTNANLDDLRHPQSIVRMQSALDRWPEIDVVYSDSYYTFIPHLPWVDVARAGLRSRLPTATRHNMFDFNSPHCAPMWRRSLHDRLGGFDETYRSAGDWEFWLRGVRAGITMRKLEDPLVAYYFNPFGMSTQVGSPSDREEAQIRRTYRELLIGPDAPLDPAVDFD